MVTEVSFKIQAYSVKELTALYNVTYKTFKKWLKPIMADLGEYNGKKYTPNQVKKIVEHVGTP